MDVVCSPWGFGASTMTLQLAQAQPYLNFLKIHPRPAQAYQCKGAPICPFTAYQGAKTLFIHMIWMWDAVHVGFGASTMTLQHHSDSAVPCHRPWYIGGNYLAEYRDSLK